MSIADSLLPEFDHEMAATRRLLERVPEAHASWKPHPKSWSLGDLAMHIANLPTWAVLILRQTEFDTNPSGGPAFPRRQWQSTAALLASFDENVQKARAAITGMSDTDFTMSWTLKTNGKPVFSLPRAAAIRSSFMNHIIHHRGQLTVYLRLRDVALPPIYGTTADTEGR